MRQRRSGAAIEPFRRRRAVARCAAAAGVLAALLVSAGCYRHVVSKKGLGRSNEPTYEPNVDESNNDPINRLLYGDEGGEPDRR